MEKDYNGVLKYAGEYKTKLDNNWLLSTEFRWSDGKERLFYVTEQDLADLHNELSVVISAFGLPLVGDEIATPMGYNVVMGRRFIQNGVKEVRIIIHAL